MRDRPRVAFLTAGPREEGLACQACAESLHAEEPIAICQICGQVHHQRCWEENGVCGSYACAPPQRHVPLEQLDALKITAADLDTAVPLPTRRPVNLSPLRTQGRSPSRTNRLSWIAFGTAVAGIPLFGVLTGLVAITLGSIALGQLRRNGQRGTGWALAGVLLGLGDVVGWLVLLTVMLARPEPVLHFGEFQLESSDLENVDPVLGRALRANVLITNASGLGHTTIGSGVILRISQAEALVVTNRHVVDSSFSGSGKAGDALPQGNVPVRLIGQPPQPGAITWFAPHGIDLALLRVPCTTPQAQAARWQHARPTRVGQPVFAVGNPHGLGWTHTQGAISQLRRQQQEGFDLRVIQTQAALNPGNSGGGLFDQEGYLVGINTWIKDKRQSEGLGFAIAFDMLLALHPPGFDLADPLEIVEKP